ncbi:uncharacterized protein LOC110629224 [Manihot esculenta]|uniref:uncharacterized protein LOC110629224 n=1 Tax=Manihot esculenta TaxID=3983 RepID=UPI000B5D3828|nr:uncharacterized protein LOC110629224 [Manihot esculenta]
MAKAHGGRVRELIENDEAESYFMGTAGKIGSEEWREGYRPEKRPRQEEEGIDQKLQRMNEQLLTELGAKDHGQTLLPASSPFSGWIQQETIPKNFMMPPMAMYGGVGNPREHFLNYKTFMELQTLSDALMCKVFPTILTGPARAWFNSLEAGSIKSFGDLANIFINRFIAGVPANRKTNYLETVRQKRNESLREYVARFNTEALQIPELDESRAVEAMQKETTSPEFFGSLCRKPPTFLAELIKRAEKYIRQDDALTTSRFAKEATDRGKAPEKRRSDRHEKMPNRGPEVYRQPWDRREQRPPLPRVPEAITPFNASRAEVLVAVQDKEFLQWPKPIRAEASQRDPDKYFQYHRTNGHDTNDCY